MMLSIISIIFAHPYQVDSSEPVGGGETLGLSATLAKESQAAIGSK